MAKPQSEDELTSWLRRRCPSIGDDAAFLPPGRDLALSTDSQREGVHFLSGTPPKQVGRRLLAVNLSDLAAVGAEPRKALCTLASPIEWDRREFFDSLLNACDDYGVELIGGDLSKSRDVHASLTVLGERVRFGRFLERSNARPGQGLWLAGALGEAHLGLRLQTGARRKAGTRPLRAAARRFEKRHRNPEPQLEIGLWLARRRSPVAAIDVSDGLALDARRLACASGVDLCFLESGLQQTSTAPDAFREVAAGLGVDPGVARLTGGEDYALLFTADIGLEPELRRLQARHFLHRVGDVRPGSGRCRMCLDESDGGREIAIADLLAEHQMGWDHLR